MNKKQIFILWLASIVITFLTGYVESVTNENYPVSGTIGIDGKKLSYKFDKTATPEKGLDIILRTDVDSVTGQFEYQVAGADNAWKENPLEVSDKTLKINFHIQKGIKQLKYRVRIFSKDKDILLQEKNQPVILNVKGRVPGMINSFFYLLLFGGLLLGTRTGLEYFNDKEKMKKLSIITAIMYCTAIIVFLPLKKIYEFQALGNKILPFSDLVDPALLSILVLWIITIILVFNIKRYKVISLIVSVLSIILFQFNQL